MERENNPTVFVVDPDESSRSAVQAVARTIGLRCEAFDSGRAFLDAYDPLRSGCLVLELRAPGLSGLQLLRLLADSEITVPVIFVSAHADVPAAVRALREGAVNFLVKPYSEQELCDSIQEAIEIDRQARAKWLHSKQIEERLERLNDRDMHMLQMIAQGKTNKAMAINDKVSIRTIEMRRGCLVKKLGVRSPSELLRLALLACDGVLGSGLVGGGMHGVLGMHGTPGRPHHAASQLALAAPDGNGNGGGNGNGNHGSAGTVRTGADLARVGESWG